MIVTPALPNSFALMAKLLRDLHIHKVDQPTGWDATVAGSGTTVQDPQISRARTGTTTASAARLNIDSRGLRIGGTFDDVNWAKRHLVHFEALVSAPDANTTGRFQFKTATSNAVLGERGIGIQVVNLALTYEGYESARQTAAGIAFVADQQVSFDILHDPNVPIIQFYRNGALDASITTASGIPSTDVAGDVFWNVSAQNGAGTADVIWDIYNIWIIQER